MKVYGSKQTPDTVFISRGVLVDSLMVFKNRLDPKDIIEYTTDLNSDATIFPLKLYQPAGKSVLTAEKVGHAKEFDLILQTYPEREQNVDVLMVRKKGVRGEYYCVLPPNYNHSGMIIGDKHDDVYINDMTDFTYDNVRVGIANVSVVDEERHIVSGKMYRYNIPSSELVRHEYNKVCMENNELPLVPVYLYSSNDTSFACIRTLKEIYVIFTILKDNEETIVLKGMDEIQTYIGIPEVLDALRAIRDHTNTQSPTYFTNNQTFEFLKDSELCKAFEDDMIYRIYLEGSVISDVIEDKKYQMRKMSAKKYASLPYKRNSILKLMHAGLVKAFTFDEDDEALTYFELSMGYGNRHAKYYYANFLCLLLDREEVLDTIKYMHNQVAGIIKNNRYKLIQY